MTTIEVVLVASSVINVLLLVLVFLSYNNINQMKIHLTQAHAGMGSLLGKMLAMEQVIAKLATGFSDFVDMTGNLLDKLNREDSRIEFGQVYRTVDGKYSARSLEELLDKIKGEDDEEKYISEDEIEKLKELFEDDDNLSDEEDE